MRTCLIIAALSLACLTQQAEAKDRRSGPAVLTVSASDAVPLRGAADAPAPEAGATMRTASAATSEPMTTGTTASPKPAAAAKPWCASGRVLGSGAGFCVIN